MFENTNKALYRFHILSSRLSNVKEHGENCSIQAAAKKEIDAAMNIEERLQSTANQTKSTLVLNEDFQHFSWSCSHQIKPPHKKISCGYGTLNSKDKRACTETNCPRLKNKGNNL